MRRAAPVLPVFPMEDFIPRVLHQHFLAGDEAIPVAIRAVRDNLRDANPEWQYRLWDAATAEAFIADTYGDAVLSRYRRINPEYYAARSDLLRYLSLYALGGVYLDIKSTCSRPLSEALRPDDKFVLLNFPHMMSGSRTEAVEGFMRECLPELADFPNGEYVQWVIASVKGHPFLRAVIERVLANIDDYWPRKHGKGGLGTLRLTGPVPYSLEIEAIRDHFPHSGPMCSTDRGFLYSGLPDGMDHRALFDDSETYYFELATPIVRLSPTARVSLAAVEAARKVPLVRSLARRSRAVLRGKPLT